MSARIVNINEEAKMPTKMRVCGEKLRAVCMYVITLVDIIRSQ
jgi:hypothetical protein